MISSCATSNSCSNCKNEDSIVGRWKILDTEFTGNPLVEMKIEETSLISLFGVGVLKNGKGKYLNFSESGELHTDLVPSELFDKFQIQYTNENRKLSLNVTQLPNKEKFSYSSEYEKKEDSLILILDSLLTIRLVRQLGD